MIDLQAVIEAAAPAGVPVHAVRFPDAETAAGPSLLWRTQRAGGGLLDFSAGPMQLILEARAPTYADVLALAADLVAGLAAAGRLAALLDEADDRDTGSGERLAYFARVLTLEMA